MPLNKEARIQKISELDESKKVGTHKIEWDGVSEYRDVYRIPISYLIYNKYNGRILSGAKSLETQGKKLDAENLGDFEKIEKLLFDSNSSRNIKTEKSIKEKGQEKPGIITKDGVVIDGNRRFMSLNRIVNNSDSDSDSEKFKYFEAVILPVNLADDSDGIRRLETIYQMGEDEKLKYNPIEKYLKAQELASNNVSAKDIALWMGENEGRIKEYLDTMKTMDDYLDYLDYQGIYTQLYEREDWFLSLTKWINNFSPAGSSDKPFDGYDDEDVNDLILVFYDYTRAKHGGNGKRFRIIANGLRSNHIFGNKELWIKFKNNHFKNITPIQDEEQPINYDSSDLESHLNYRDNKFIQKSEECLKENLNDRISELFNKQKHDQPEKLIVKASSALKEVNIKANSFLKNDTQKELQELSNKVSELLFKSDSSLILKQSLALLNNINSASLSNEDKDERLKIVTEINKLSFDFKKELGG